MAKRKIKVEDLTKYLEEILKEEFVACVAGESGGLRLKFESGIEYFLKVEELN